MSDTIDVSMKILVVDDDRLQRMVISRVAVGLGFAVTEAASVEEIPSRLAVVVPDVVILDLSLGENDGIEALHCLTGLNEPPAVIIMSGQDGRVRDVVRRYVRALGLRDLGELTKPVNISKLKDLLSDIPRGHQALAHPVIDISPEEVVSALHADEIRPAYQPKVRLDTGLIVGVEALARWTSRRAGYISPDVFCAMIEVAGLSMDLTASMLHFACRDVAIWRKSFPDMTVSVNVPPSVAANPRFYDIVVSALAENDLAPGALTLELLETASAKEDHTRIARMLTRLRIRGVGLAVDDFGTGFSSLTSLHTLPFGEMKIDASFVRSCDRDRYAWSIVKASIAMAREFDMITVAEGIETEAIRDRLRGAGCEFGQGMLFSPAVDTKDIDTMLASRARILASQHMRQVGT